MGNYSVMQESELKTGTIIIYQLDWFNFPTCSIGYVEYVVQSGYPFNYISIKTLDGRRIFEKSTHITILDISDIIKEN